MVFTFLSLCLTSSSGVFFRVIIIVRTVCPLSDFGIPRECISDFIVRCSINCCKFRPHILLIPGFSNLLTVSSLLMSLSVHVRMCYYDAYGNVSLSASIESIDELRCVCSCAIDLCHSRSIHVSIFIFRSQNSLHSIFNCLYS